MKCKNHNETEANYYCSYCGQPLCLECSVELNRKLYCKECLEKSIEVSKINFSAENKFKKSKFLTFLLSLIPGAGHMYLGLLNKGLSIMVIFFGLIFISETLDNLIFIRAFSNDAFFVSLFVIFISYSLFDALAKVNEINAGIIVNDTNVIEISRVYGYIKNNILVKKTIIGYALVVLGFLSILNVFSRAIGDLLMRFFNFRLPFTMTDVIISLLLICCGVFLIKKGRGIGA
jgi:hypothetical protein